ncbi:rubrerythrin-like domain-containing protein [Halomarina halobia]|uniref:Rubrerythrin-like domain-containing protein n=1 Tax=Halomarina halobia TaxID=3033386 RepID=A0ABD6AAK8_9EURY|nr:rubrerythrin-like domain-containing protein [Halomarina sp. PSR21]
MNLERTGGADPYYECMDCQARYDTAEGGRLCRRCGGYLRNLAVPRNE